MKKYVKLSGNKCINVAEGNDESYFKGLGMILEEVELSDVDNCYYLKGYAPMKSEQQKKKEADEQRILKIDTTLIEIDSKSIRDLRNFVVGLISKVSTIKITEPLKAIKTFFDVIAELGGQSGHLEQFDIDAANLRKERQELWNKWHKGV